MLRRSAPPPPPPPAAPDRRQALRLESGLRPLSERSREFEVADGHHDVRGWLVTAAGGTVVGSVRDLIVDLDTMVARYVHVELGPQGTDEGIGRHVLVPVASVELRPGTDEVHVPGMRAAAFAELPEFRRDLLDKDWDAGLLRRIGVRAVLEGRPEDEA